MWQARPLVDSSQTGRDEATDHGKLAEADAAGDWHPASGDPGMGLQPGGVGGVAHQAGEKAGLAQKGAGLAAQSGKAGHRAARVGTGAVWSGCWRIRVSEVSADMTFNAQELGGGECS